MNIINLIQILCLVYKFVNFIQYDFNSEVLHEVLPTNWDSSKWAYLPNY